MVRSHNKRIAAIVARENSSRSSFKSNQRLGKQLGKTPSEVYPVIGNSEPQCSHGFKYASTVGPQEFVDPTHNCHEYENAKRAARGAPPLER